MKTSGTTRASIKFPALAFEYKDKPGVYIREHGGETTNIEDAFLMVYEDGSKPDKEQCKEYFFKREKEEDEFLKKQFGENAINNYKPSEWFKHCNLIDVYISSKKFKEMISND
ncbi:hypothetical protein [Staphylococcus pasteuri]|uniref:hypothetical protein n=1 Tax=Staphylococcus pasteuri TaxID=45972 RepID=UPI000F84E735|nr:hypothetical protein [Staphylococcus pasteuri]MEB6612104.1 hypothetical protein [Staphylococcus pasteuri]QQN53638.1 hypothetical protein I6I26_09705 [Staphylococcus pasteuri]RTX74140.1 hypothetical protein CD121_05450 [Staphylococcus pasteuri]